MARRVPLREEGVGPMMVGRQVSLQNRRTYGNTLSRVVAASLVFGAAAAVAAFIEWAPWPLGFGAAIACATGWCIWLQD